MARWSREQVEAVCQQNGWLHSTREIQNGIQFKLSDSTTVNWYTTGKVVVGGKKSPLKAAAEEAFGVAPPVQVASPALEVGGSAVEPFKRVFIVYGHDAYSRDALELVLRRLSLEPIVLQNIPSAGDTIIEKLEVLTAADFACVLLTPDDEGHAMGQDSNKRPRARQNVVLELGMVLARLGRKRVAILVKGELERPSDIDGLIYLPFKNHIDEVKNHLAANLQKAGFPIQVEDLLG